MTKLKQEYMVSSKVSAIVLAALLGLPVFTAIPAAALSTSDMWFNDMVIADRKCTDNSNFWGFGTPVNGSDSIGWQLDGTNTDNVFFTHRDYNASTEKAGVKNASGYSFFGGGKNDRDWGLTIHNPTGSSATVYVEMYERDGTLIDALTKYDGTATSPPFLVKTTGGLWESANDRWKITVPSYDSVRVEADGEFFNTPGANLGNRMRTTIHLTSTSVVDAQLDGWNSFHENDGASSMEQDEHTERYAVLGTQTIETTETGGSQTDLMLKLPYGKDYNGKRSSGSHSFHTLIFLTNTSGATQNVDVTAYNMDGTTTNTHGTETISMAADATRLISPSQLVSSSSVTTYEGYFEIVGDQSIVGIGKHVIWDKKLSATDYWSYSAGTVMLKADLVDE